MKCVHCLEETGNTRDHVFPKAWYPNNTPGSTQRPTVPSCRACNGKFGAMEETLFQKLGVCIDPDIAAASGIKEKVLRSFGVGVDKSKMTQRDQMARLNRLKKLMSETKSYPEFGSKVFPGLGPHAGYPLELQRGFPAPTKELEEVSMKIVRGMEYWLGRRYVEKPLKAEVYIYVEEKIPEVEYLLQLGKQHIFGPGFEVTRVAGPSQLAVIYQILIWGTLRVFGSVMAD